MSKGNIFIVEDEEDMLNLINYNLVKEGYTVNCFNSGESVLQSVKTVKPDLILLDVMLSGINGLEVCKIIKGDPETWSTPIIILTARSDELDIITGFELGADDYITKPFSERILIARIKASIRKNKRKKTEETSTIKINDMIIDPSRHEVLIKNKIIELTFSEFRVLHFLAKNVGRVYTRYQIVEAIRGDEYFANDRSIDVLIVRLRKKLGSYGKYIETIYGIGYRFKEIND